jgi:ubiquitin-conjugating enzyme E2 D/E
LFFINSATNFFIDDPYVASIAQQLLSKKEEHDKTAREWTKRYASSE